MRTISLRLIALLIVFLASANAYADSRKDFADATALYSKQKYTEAMSAFAAIAEKNPSEPSPLYYEANCQIALGRTSVAVSLYKSVMEKFPKSAEATSARSVLQRMGVKLPPEPASVAAGVTGDKGGKSGSTIKSASRGPMTAQQKEGIIDKIVVQVRSQADRPNVSEATMVAVREALKVYPTPLLGVLYAKNCKIYVTTTMIDKEPQLVNTQPTGYEEGSTFRNCPGMFDGDIVLCEKMFVGDGPDLTQAPDIIGTLKHELGHAVDRYCGHVTAQDSYKHQYLLDLGTIDDDVKNKLAYFCQKDRRGPAETFAELMCFKYGGRPSGNTRTAMVDSSFKLTKKYVDTLINEIDGSKSK